MHGQVGIDIDLRDAFVAFGLGHFLGVVSARDDRREAAIVFLLDQCIACRVSEWRVIFFTLCLDSSVRDCARVGNRGEFSEPSRIGASHVVHRLGVVIAERSRDEQRPAVVLDQDRREVGP